MKEKIAIIGSGMAGLAAGWFCHQTGREVTILEAHHRRGMDAHTILFGESGQSGHVDIPLRVMNTHSWPSVLELCRRVGVETFPVHTPVACSWMDGATWFRTESFRIGKRTVPWTGSRFLLTAAPYRILWGFYRLSREVGELESSDLTLGDFVQLKRPDPLFWKGLILPLLTTICTCSQDSLNRWPAGQVLKLLNRIVFGTELLRMSGGTRALAGKLGESLKWYSGNHVKRLDIRSQGIFLHSEKAALGPFSRVICAVQANQLGFLPPNFSRERNLLSSFSYDTGTLWTHRDHRFMPQRRNDWRPLHYQMSDGFDPSMFTVWVNPIEPTLAGSEPVFQTWNPLFEPEPQTVLSAVPLQRAVVSRQNSALLTELARIHKEPDRRVFFCGSYAAPGVPLLESAVCSSLRLVRYLGLQTPKNSADKIFDSNSELEKFPDLAA